MRQSSVHFNAHFTWAHLQKEWRRCETVVIDFKFKINALVSCPTVTAAMFDNGETRRRIASSNIGLHRA